MHDKYYELANSILKLKTRDDAIVTYQNNKEEIEKLELLDKSLARKALKHITDLLTPEDYDDDICD